MRSDTITMERELAEAEAALVYLRDKAVAFDWLADGIAKEEIDIFINLDDGINEVTISVLRPGYKGWHEYTASTLAEAVRLAMEAEGAR